MESQSSGGAPPPTDAGAVRLTGAAEQLWLWWVVHLKRLLRGEGSFVMHAPGLISEDVLTRSRYIEHFPQNVLRAVPERTGEPRDDAGSDSSSAPELVLTPACCLHLYAEHAGSRLPHEGISGIVYGPCGRYEGGRWSAARLSSFTMLEWVAMGSESRVARLDQTVRPIVSGAFAALGFNLNLVDASDPFFAGEASGPAVLQRMTGAKQEWRSRDGTALASVNLHHDAYGMRFDIRAEDGPAHSMCVAFGIERLVRESLRAWGESKDGWPSEVSGNGTLP